MSELIGLDFETYGATDLPTHGLERYVSCKTFRPLIASISWRDHVKIYRKERFILATDLKGGTEWLREKLGSYSIVAHNAPFERRVLQWLGIDLPAIRFIDSAVVARAAGAGSSLEAAAPQLLGIDKMESGKQLIRLFSIPGKYQEANGDGYFDPQIITDHPVEWSTFGDYCDLDAELGLKIGDRYLDSLTEQELEYQAITMDMNQRGWKVDVDTVEEMQRRYLENQEQALHDFRRNCDALELNLNSLKQLKEWCLERGIKATSFDEKHVEKLHATISRKVLLVGLEPEKAKGYCEVLSLLETKQVLGGASLKKLQTILDTQSEGRLKDQYLHCGAGQTLRTTGRSVQMQNLKRLTSDIADMDELMDPAVEWDNTKLAQNLRQCFTATDPDGALIVGDFSSVESRGEAYLANAKWKTREFRAGKDMYKVLATAMFGVPYDAVTKDQRQAGKVGELSCGYGAGPGAVQAFAAGMGIEMTEAEAAKLVSDWRATNPEIVAFWSALDQMLHECVEQGKRRELGLPDGLTLVIQPCATPLSLAAQHPAAQSVGMHIRDNSGRAVMRRYFHGCYVRGRNISYYRPSDRKTGDLWKSHFVDPKTKQVRFFELYGGKLAGILTQSFCREIFFRSLEKVHRWASRYEDSVTLVGQFHDEIVVDWKPGGGLSLNLAKRDLERLMSDPGSLTSFPLAAEIKHDYRYTK